ncbi:SusD-like starch-binding protein associating with outer membrane [Pontibacter ummariensis]|uniref:Starch-binding associating with outer membrane n=1 Tax=Pontibacter ummariensis TaxID=1610492 RepID=A0A239K8H1_9BACT|nr:SusD/RagB family nutrient-binding outer membrane lipoprotein [Pontibacter ummariensis]PRY06038.1 SusD-like starch-binding protein associating with outer membrane [Pontibacter ummariensis]SNT14260.1 Starch-binding associating with outer membrane [Pontibacter ummariensis]
MKKVLYILLSLALAQGFVACDTVDFGDMNENQNGPADPYPAGLLAGAIENYSTVTGRSYFLVPTLLVQYQSQVTYTDEMLYAESPYEWENYYNIILPALNQVIAYNLNEDNHGAELEAQGAPVNQAGVAMIMKAIVMKRVTDTWGDVPYSQAFLGLGDVTPAYDKQEDIYKALIEELQTARDMLDPALKGPIGDLIYGGNVAKWKQLANSVLLQMALQMSEVYPAANGYAAQVFQEALAHPAGVIDDVAEEAWYTFDEVAQYQNPFNPNRARDYFLSAEFVDAFQGDTGEGSLNPTSNDTFDARLYVYSTDAELDGVPYGYNDESGSGRAQVSTDYFWNATAPLPMMTASYTYLNRAEAAVRGWTTEDAEEMLAKGIVMSFVTWDAHSEEDIASEGEAYAAARLEDAEEVGMYQVIGEEKWKTLFPQGFDAWAEWRRTEFPVLYPATDYLNDGQIPRRYLYPAEEATLNRENYAAGVGALNPATDNNTARVWWDVE